MSMFHSAKDEKALLEGIEDICTKHRELELKEPPTKEQRAAVLEDIIQFIKKKKRVVYGGFAMHCLIVQASKGKDFVYNDLCCPDVEFYTSTLKEDVQELCDLLSRKYAYVVAEEGVHPTTFKVRAEFIDHCDITYYPARFMEAIPTIDLDNGLRVVAPEFAIMNTSRVYVYPLNNYFRLTKDFKRANKLLKYYPLTFKASPMRQAAALPLPPAPRTTMILTGIHAHNVFCKEVGIKGIQVDYPVYVSVSYNNDMSALGMKYPEKREYLPFMDLLGKRTDFYKDGKVVCSLIEERFTCIPYKVVDGQKITTLQGTFYYLLVAYFKARMDKDKTSADLCETLLHNLMECKKKYYQKHPSKKITSDGLFQEFVVECMGHFRNSVRQMMLDREDRRKTKRPLKYRYNPKLSNNSGFDAMRVSVTLGELDSGRGSLRFHQKKVHRRPK